MVLNGPNVDLFIMDVVILLLFCDSNVDLFIIINSIIQDTQLGLVSHVYQDLMFVI